VASQGVQFVSKLNMAALLYFGATLVIDGSLTVGELVAFNMLSARVTAPVLRLAQLWQEFHQARLSVERLGDILNTTAEPTYSPGRAALPAIRGDVTFEHVGFRYRIDGPEVLSDISLKIPAGQIVGIVGSSGSGKSTLIGLVMAFHRPTRGRILVDGDDLANLRLRDYRHHLGAVFQDNFLFDGSIAENIAYSRPHATPEEILAAAKVAHCDEFVDGFEKGYETIVGERGVKLSGGQRQRVAIARAVLANPTILILDEATSSLDSESEAMIQDGLATLRAGRTTFVIAHRLSTIRAAEQILVIEEGEVVEHGTHRELIARDGRYKQLHDRQYRLETDRFINPGEDFTPPTEDGAAAAVKVTPTGRL
jgi:subfamily B ATP-binding cassette protein HlyB/CyaB